MRIEYEELKNNINVSSIIRINPHTLEQEVIFARKNIMEIINYEGNSHSVTFIEKNGNNIVAGSELAVEGKIIIYSKTLKWEKNNELLSDSDRKKFVEVFKKNESFIFM